MEAVDVPRLERAAIRQPLAKRGTPTPTERNQHSFEVRIEVPANQLCTRPRARSRAR